MRRFFTTILDTVTQRLLGDEPARDPAQLARIRQAMLDLLPQSETPSGDWPTERLRHRLLVTTDPRSLWFMRAELNQLLCQRLGERRAFALVAQLTPLFDLADAPGRLSPAARRPGAPARNAAPTSR